MPVKQQSQSIPPTAQLARRLRADLLLACHRNAREERTGLSRKSCSSAQTAALDAAKISRCRLAKQTSRQRPIGVRIPYGTALLRSVSRAAPLRSHRRTPRCPARHGDELLLQRKLAVHRQMTAPPGIRDRHSFQFLRGSQPPVSDIRFRTIDTGQRGAGKYAIPSRKFLGMICRAASFITDSNPGRS